jgi:predicted amidohydrolase
MDRYEHRSAANIDQLRKQGVTPGASAPLFQTDFGKIGVQICFDVNWHENWRSLKQRGAEIIFWPSAYPAHRMISALAWMNECYVVSSTLTRACRIYDITGEVLAQSGVYQPWAQGTVYLGKRLFEIDFELTHIRDIARKYGRRVQIQWYHDEDWFTLTSVDPDLATEDIIAEFAMVPLQAYHARCERAADAARRAATGG